MINQQKLDDLISDIEYLKYEIQSLSKVISFVPYSRKPLGGESIIENLLSINSAQSKIVTVLEALKKQGEEIQLKDFSIFERVELSEEEIENLTVSTVLKDIEGLRTDLVNFLREKPSSYFEIEMTEESKPVSVLDILWAMVTEERKSLKEIAHLVLTYQSDKQVQREIAARPKH